VRELTEIISLLDQVLNDPQKPYFLTIVRLDENWIEEKLRYRLIHALIDSVKEFRRVRNAKIIVAIRYDLLDRVYKFTRDMGFQEEKLESLYLPLTWTKHRLVEVLNARIQFLSQKRSRSQRLSYSDVLPEKIMRQPAVDYVLARTLMRPRDVILFFNKMIEHAVNRKAITPAIMKKAEGEYSRLRFRSLIDEWHGTYPNLAKFALILKSRRSHFSITDVTEDEVCEFCLQVLSGGVLEKDSFSTMAEQVVDLIITPKDFRKAALQIFYRVALIGLKLDRFERTSWITTGRPDVSSAEIDDEVRVEVHPAFWRVLGVVAR
jgi:hypothetical protein